MIFKTKTFGEIEVEKDGVYVVKDIEVRKCGVSCGLYVNGGLAGDRRLLDNAAVLVDRIADLHEKAIDAIKEGYSKDKNGVVADYLDFYINGAGIPFVEAAFSDINKSDITPELILDNLKLVSVKINPAGDDVEITLNYAVTHDYLHELLIVRFDKDGNIGDIGQGK